MRIVSAASIAMFAYLYWLRFGYVIGGGAGSGLHHHDAPKSGAVHQRPQNLNSDALPRSLDFDTPHTSVEVEGVGRRVNGEDDHYSFRSRDGADAAAKSKPE